VQSGLSGVYGNPPPPELRDGGPEIVDAAEVPEASSGPRLTVGPDAAPRNDPPLEHPSCALARQARARNQMIDYNRYSAQCRDSGGTP
jgi:hypothetical protein